MSTPFAVSPSQISLWRMCRRRWAWKYLAGLPEPQHPSAALGEEVHHLLEDWEKEGKVPEGGARADGIALKMIDHVPTGEGLSVEQKMRFAYGGVMWSGRKDLEYRDDATLVVHDHKTTSDLKWAKSAEELREDPQGIMYAFEAFQRHPDDSLRLDWLYGTTGAKTRIRKVSLTVLRDDVEHAMRTEILPVGQDLALLKENPVDPLTLEPSPAACSKFPPVGCPFVERCTDITSGDHLAAALSSATVQPTGTKPTMTLAQRLASAKKTAPPPAEAPRTTPTLAEKVGAAPARAEGINPPVYAKPERAEPGTPENLIASMRRLEVPEAAIRGTLQNRFPRLASADIDALLAGATIAQVDQVNAALNAASQIIEQNRSVLASVPPVAEPAKPKAGPGRGKKKADALAAADFDSGATPVNAPSLGDDSGPMTAPAGITVGFTLVVDSFFTKGGPDTVTLADYLAPVHAQLRAELDLKHYKLADYGKGVGLLNEAVRAYLEQAPPTGALLVDSRTPEGADLLNLLTAHAAVVIRGN